MVDSTTQAGVLNFLGLVVSPMVSAAVAWFAGKWRGDGKFSSEIEEIKEKHEKYQEIAAASQQKCETENHVLREAASMLVACIQSIGNLPSIANVYLRKVEDILDRKD